MRELWVSRFDYHLDFYMKKYRKILMADNSHDDFEFERNEDGDIDVELTVNRIESEMQANRKTSSNDREVGDHSEVHEINVQQITEIGQQFGAAKTRQNEWEFGFEGLKSNAKSGAPRSRSALARAQKEKVKKKGAPPKGHRERPAFTVTTTSESNSNAIAASRTAPADEGNSRSSPNSAEEPPPKKRCGNDKSTEKGQTNRTATVTATLTNKENSNPKLWASYKGSRTTLLSKYFESVSNTLTADGKMDVVCTLCPNKNSLRITKGNNSNLVKHLKMVIQQYCFFIHTSRVLEFYHNVGTEPTFTMTFTMHSLIDSLFIIGASRRTSEGLG